MKTFDFHRARDVDDALDLASRTGATYYAGGTNLLDLMKLGVAAPTAVVDVSRLGLDHCNR